MVELKWRDPFASKEYRVSFKEHLAEEKECAKESLSDGALQLCDGSKAVKTGQTYG